MAVYCHSDNGWLTIRPPLENKNQTYLAKFGTFAYAREAKFGHTVLFADVNTAVWALFKTLVSYIYKCDGENTSLALMVGNTDSYPNETLKQMPQVSHCVHWCLHICVSTHLYRPSAITVPMYLTIQSTISVTETTSTPAVNGGALYHVGDNWQTFFSGHFRNVVRTTKGQSTPLADNISIQTRSMPLHQHHWHRCIFRLHKMVWPTHSSVDRHLKTSPIHTMFCRYSQTWCLSLTHL